MAINSEIDKTNKQVIEPTFPALYIWNVVGDCFGEIHLFTDKYTSTILVSVIGDRAVGNCSSTRLECTAGGFRRLAIGEKVILENSD